jgi:transposase InsO family protein
VFRDIGMPPCGERGHGYRASSSFLRRRNPGTPSRSDVKFVKIGGRWAFQYTALDDCTRFRVLRLYRRLHQSSSLAVLTEISRGFPFRIRKLQVTTGKNGKVERSHRIDQEEFWGRRRFDDFDAAAVGLRAWERHYNHERFSTALQGRTPAEKLAALMPAVVG